MEVCRTPTNWFNWICGSLWWDGNWKLITVRWKLTVWEANQCPFASKAGNTLHFYISACELCCHFQATTQDSRVLCVNVRLSAYNRIKWHESATSEHRAPPGVWDTYLTVTNSNMNFVHIFFIHSLISNSTTQARSNYKSKGAIPHKHPTNFLFWNKIF